MKNSVTALLVAFTIVLSSVSASSAQDIGVGVGCAAVVPCVAPDFNIEPVFLNGACAETYIKICAKEKSAYMKFKADRKKAIRAERAKKAKAKRGLGNTRQ